MYKLLCHCAFHLRCYNNFNDNYEFGEVWGNLTTGLGNHTIHVHGRGREQPFSGVYYPCGFCNPVNIDNIIIKPNNVDDKIGRIKY
jgi:hypothetical protein